MWCSSSGRGWSCTSSGRYVVCSVFRRSSLPFTWPGSSLLSESSEGDDVLLFGLRLRGVPKTVLTQVPITASNRTANLDESKVVRMSGGRDETHHRPGCFIYRTSRAPNPEPRGRTCERRSDSQSPTPCALVLSGVLDDKKNEWKRSAIA